MTQFDLNIYKDFIKNKSYENNVTTQIQASKKAETTVVSNLKNLNDEFVKTKNNRGLVEKVYDFCKNITNFGSGYKKLENKISLVKSGKLSESELKNDIEKYKISNYNAKQTFGDITSSFTAVGSYFLITKVAAKLNSRFKLNAAKVIENGILHSFPKKYASKILSTLKNTVASSVKTKFAVAVPVAMLAGGFTKYFTLKINRIGSKEFEIGKKKDLGKEKYKAAKKEMKSRKRSDSFKNFWTGMTNGLLAPVTAIAGGIVGVPLYVLSGFGMRYATSDSKNKSLSDFGEKLKDNAIINTLATAVIAIPLLRKANYSKIFHKNLSEVTKELSSAKLINPDLAETRGALIELEDTLLNSEAIRKIMHDRHLSLPECITKLTEENLFAVKFKQIMHSNDALTIALREKCPVTRTLEEAQTEIQKLLGDSNYQVSKCLGVGTVAETYLAKDATGKEVAIKIIKKGITKEKILADKNKFLNLVTNGLPEEQLSQHQIYLKRNIENLAESILKEIDLKNEAEAAKQLAKVTHKANVVVPILAKDGVYVMEKANGISVSALADYVQAKSDLESAKKYAYSFLKKPEEYEAEIAKIKASSPAFEDFDITPDQIKKLLKEYIDIQTEQFVKLNKKGKIIHGDIHPGNIFIDLNVLKGKNKGKLFTLIDTGNTIQLTKEQTKDFLKIISYVKNGNYKDIARIVTEESFLPEGITREEARKFVEAELKKYFTDTTHKLNTMTLDTLFNLTDAIQASKGIIPNNTQLTLMKSKQSAMNSFRELGRSFGELKFGNVDDNNPIEIAKASAVAVKEIADIGAKYLTSSKKQEFKNLFQMSPKEVLAYFRNKNMLPTNSKEHLIYELKQCMNNTPNFGV